MYVYIIQCVCVHLYMYTHACMCMHTHTHTVPPPTHISKHGLKTKLKTYSIPQPEEIIQVLICTAVGKCSPCCWGCFCSVSHTSNHPDGLSCQLQEHGGSGGQKLGCKEPLCLCLLAHSKAHCWEHGRVHTGTRRVVEGCSSGAVPRGAAKVPLE